MPLVICLQSNVEMFSVSDTDHKPAQGAATGHQDQEK